jgi:tRNA pseudouridine38-40 synthase
MNTFLSNTPIHSKKIAVEVEYDGSSYYGWQIQKKPSMPTVQAEIERALSVVANEPVHTYCAGRTDSGVHATSQTIHFETQAIRSEKSWVCGANVNLPRNIVVKWARPVAENFHARFSATARTYRYIILNSPVRSAILDKKVTVIQQQLNIQVMQEAADFLLGENDFSAYRGSGCQSNTPFRFVEYIKVSRQDNFVITEICANAFLLHMVRNIMGVLIEIGLGNRPAEWAQVVLQGKDRTRAAKTAPPDGLYFVQAHYPDHHHLPETPFGPAFIHDE